MKECKIIVVIRRHFFFFNVMINVVIIMFEIFRKLLYSAIVKSYLLENKLRHVIVNIENVRIRVKRKSLSFHDRNKRPAWMGRKSRRLSFLRRSIAATLLFTETRYKWCSTIRENDRYSIYRWTRYASA